MTLCALTFLNTSFIEEALKYGIPATDSSKINTFNEKVLNSECGLD